MKCLTLIILIIAITGCANTNPYTEIGVGYDITRTNMEKFEGWDTSEASKYSGVFEVGVEVEDVWVFDFLIGAKHDSYIFVSTPFNDKWEFSTNKAFVNIKCDSKCWGKIFGK